MTVCMQQLNMSSASVLDIRSVIIITSWFEYVGSLTTDLMHRPNVMGVRSSSCVSGCVVKEIMRISELFIIRLE